MNFMKMLRRLALAMTLVTALSAASCFNGVISVASNDKACTEQDGQPSSAPQSNESCTDAPITLR